MDRTHRLLGASPDRESGMEGLGAGWRESIPLVDFGLLFGVLRRRLGLIALVALVSMIVAAVYDATQVDQFAANASIMLEEPGVVPLGERSVFSETNQASNPVFESQLQLIRSPYFLAQVVETLALDERPEFMSSRETPFVRALGGYVDQAVDLVRQTGVLPAEDAEDEPVVPPELLFENAVGKLRDSLTATRNGLTLVISIRVVSPNPDLSAEIANAVAQTYVDDRQSSRSDGALKASEWFEGRIADLNERAVRAEGEIARFKADAQIVNAGREGLVSEIQIAAISAELNQAKQLRQEAKSKLDQLSALMAQGTMPIPIPDNLSSDAMRDLYVRYAQLQIDREAFALQYGEDHAATLDLDNQLEVLETRIRREIGQLIAAAQADYEVTEAHEIETQASYDTIITAANGVESSQVKLRALESEAQVYRQLHDSYLENFLQTVQQQSFPMSDARVIAGATVPDSPSGTSLRWTLFAAAVIGTALGTGAAFATESIDRRIRTRAKFADAIGAPVLGILPPPTSVETDAVTGVLVSQPRRPSGSSLDGKLTLPPKRQALKLSEGDLSLTINRPLSTYSDTARRIKIAVDSMGGSGNSVVAFISDAPTSRRSILAINYAEMLALGGAQTILLDCDWYHMFLTKTVAPNATFGLADVVMPDGTATPETLFWYDERTGLSFLPNRSTAGSASVDPGVFDIDRMRSFLRQLSSRFDNVVIDCSNLSDSANAAAYAEEVTGYVVVALWGETNSGVLAGEIARSGIPRHKIVGGVLDGVTFSGLKQYESVG
jgi:polysaccharide biosynthesis transport protein